MKTEGTLIYHKIAVATGLLQNNAYGHELVLFCLIIPCVHCLFMFYFYKKCKWLFWFCVHRHRSMRSIAQSIDRTVIDPCIRTECKSDLEQFSPVTSSDEDVNILTICFCLIFLYRVEVATLVLRPSRSIDRSIDQSIGCYKSSIRVDYKVRSRVVFSGNI